MSDTETIVCGPCPKCGTGVQLIDAPTEPDGIACRRIPATRYCLTKDDDGHLYIIPADKAEEATDYFEAVYNYWRDMPEDADEPPRPDWLREVGHALSRVTFERPRIGEDE